jgi:hypothetical protein
VKPRKIDFVNRNKLALQRQAFNQTTLIPTHTLLSKLPLHSLNTT